MLKYTLMINNVPVERIDINIITVAQFLVFVVILCGVYFNLKSKTFMNYQSLKNVERQNTDSIACLEKQLSKDIKENNDKISNVKHDHIKAFDKIDKEVSGIKKDISQIGLSIGNIEGYMKAMSEKK